MKASLALVLAAIAFVLAVAPYAFGTLSGSAAKGVGSIR